MFIKITKQGYTRDGEQFAHGYFMILMHPPLSWQQFLSAEDVRAMIVYVRMRQCGHFMMATVKLSGEQVTLSGTYGADGLIAHVSEEVWKQGTPLPEELYNLWAADTQGWNSEGSEGKAMLEFGTKLLKSRHKSRKYVYDYYTIDLKHLMDDFTADELLNIAITEAKEHSKLYAIPAEWTAHPIENKPGLFSVRRKRVKA